MLSEDHIAGGSVGELLHTVLVDQFTRLRDGDRFYYENVFSGTLLDQLQNTRLSEIIRRNTNLQNVQDEVFRGANVFTYRAPEGFRAANISLRVRGDELQIVRGSSNRVLASQALADTSIVVIYGTSRNDNIRIDKSVADAYRGSVELHGGGGGNDRLLVQGRHRADHVQVTPTSIAIDDLSLYYGNFERVRVPGGHGGFHLEPQEVGWVVGAAVAGGRGWDNAGLTGQGRLALPGRTLPASCRERRDHGQWPGSSPSPLSRRSWTGCEPATTHALRQDRRRSPRRGCGGRRAEPHRSGLWGLGKWPCLRCLTGLGRVLGQGKGFVGGRLGRILVVLRPPRPISRAKSQPKRLFSPSLLITRNNLGISPVSSDTVATDEFQPPGCFLGLGGRA